MANAIYEKLMKCTEAVKSRISFKPEVALILGSGLGDYAQEMEIVETVEYADIEGFPVSTVAGHQGRFLFGYVKGVPVVAMQGRVHYYEGYAMSDVVLPTRLMGLLGAKTIILTNAAGGVNVNFQPGDLMMITDQITTMVPSPLIGPNLDELGPRFPDMSEIYKKDLRAIIRQAARNTQVSIQSGVYMQFTGPSYETPAEIRMCRTLGGDAAGMSTACEAMAANHMGMRVCGISCITNLAAGMSTQPLNHKEVQETADRVASEFKKLVTETIRLIGEKVMNEKELIRLAHEARKKAYTPYSGFQVGAALLTRAGKVYLGCNIENAAYGPTNCAERTAFFKAVSEGEREFEAIAIVGGAAESEGKETCAPCGVCRQVMREFCDPQEFKIHLEDGKGGILTFTLAELLPLGFGPENLGK